MDYLADMIDRSGREIDAATVLETAATDTLTAARYIVELGKDVALSYPARASLATVKKAIETYGSWRVETSRGTLLMGRIGTDGSDWVYTSPGPRTIRWKGFAKRALTAQALRAIVTAPARLADRHASVRAAMGRD